MTKRRPEKVIEYRISLQDKERELLEHLVYVEGTAKAFNQFTEPFVEILKDNTAMLLILSVVAGYLGWEYIANPALTNAGELLADWQAQYGAVKETLDEKKKQSQAATEFYLTTIPGVGPVFEFLLGRD